MHPRGEQSGCTIKTILDLRAAVAALTHVVAALWRLHLKFD